MVVFFDSCSSIGVWGDAADVEDRGIPIRGMLANHGYDVLCARIRGVRAVVQLIVRSSGVAPCLMIPSENHAGAA